MQYFPFFFDLRGRRVLLVGGGEVARRKAELLSRAEAHLVAVAPDIAPQLTELLTADRVLQREYRPSDLDGCTAVVAATDDDALNRQVCQDARARRVPVNVVDNPELCDFIFPAVIDRSPLAVAVSSGGASPVLARRVRAKIEEMLPPESGRLAEFCARFRTLVQTMLPSARRRQFWEQTLDGAAAEAVLAGDESGGEDILRKELHRFAEEQTAVGEVYLIGAGPGCADLLTLRAHRLLQKADVVVVDRLVSPEVLELARRDAEKIFVGKQRGFHSVRQEDIHQILIEHAKRGLRVARLKGGDPFVFGRGGEELQALRAANIPFQIAPGITAALGCAAAAGVPLTHRDLAGSVRFCTASSRELTDAGYWQRLATDRQCTLVFYMAGASLTQIADNLTAAGRAADTPCTLICAGTTAAQQVIKATLADIAECAARQHSPALLIVGEVASFASGELFLQTAAPFPHLRPAGQIEQVKQENTHAFA